MLKARTPSRRLRTQLASFTVLAAPLAAQCDLEWRSAGGYPGADATVYAATSWDPDGPGPANALVVFGGSFSIIGDAVAQGVASYDATTNHCAPLGAGIGGTVHALLALPNGHLIAAGSFATAGGAAAANIARFDGNAWTSVGGGLAGTVHALARASNGDIIAAGAFAGGNIARWDGVAWSPFGGGTNAAILALAAAPNGDVVAGGDFTSAGGAAANRIARWSSGAWQPLGAGFNAQVSGVALLPNGDVLAAGSFTTAGGVAAPNAALWNGIAWSGNGPTGFLERGQSLTWVSSGTLVLGTFGSGRAYTWTGTGWQYFMSVSGSGVAPGGLSTIHCAATAANGDLLIVGEFLSTAVSSSSPTARRTLRVVRVTGGQMVGLGRIDRPVADFAQTTSGIAAIGAGDPPSHLGLFTGQVDVWNGATWDVWFSALPGPTYGLGGLANGGLLVAGRFQVTTYTGPGGNPVTTHYAVARLGSTLQYSLPGALAFPPVGIRVEPLPTGGFVVVYSLFPSGTPAGGDIAVYDALGNHTGALPSLQGNVMAVSASSAGTIYAGGSITSVNNCARFNGSQWQALGAGMNAPVHALAATADGGVIAGGEFTTAGGAPANRIARWNGSAWSPLGSGVNGTVRACVELPNGDVVVGGSFTIAGGVPANNVARWNGTAWSAVGGGTNGAVRTMLLAPDGEVWLGGDFTTAGQLGCGYAVRLVSPCPATVTSLGSGCTGAGGLNVLTATSLPWQGTMFSSRATGMPPFGLVIQVNGLSPLNVPLAAILPQAGAGCTLLASPDVLGVYISSSGGVDMSLPLPATSMLVGTMIYQQAAPFELDASGSIIGFTSSNLLHLTVGGM